MNWQMPSRTTLWSTLWLLLVVCVGCFATACDIPAFETGSTSNVQVPATPDEAASSGGDAQAVITPEQTAADSEPGPAVGDAGPDAIVEAGLDEPTTLNPVLLGDQISEEISQLIFSGLVSLAPESHEPVGDLAESWDVSEDGLTYTFHLRSDVTWHDGQPFTARDVVFTYDLMMNEETRSPRYSRLVERVASVSATDDHTVVFRLIAPYSPFLTTLATFGIVPQHLLQDVIPEEMVTDPFGTSTAIGTGPFALEQWNRGERIILRANRDYHGGAPAIDRYEYTVAIDEQAILTGVQEGVIDWARIPPRLMDEAEGMENVQVRSMPGYKMIGIALQLDTDETRIFEDRRVRQALMLALDREHMVEEIWQGHAAIANGTLPPASWANQPSDVEYDYDPEAAADLLADAGWVTDDDGIRMRDGQLLQFTVTANGENQRRRALAEWIAQSWREIGIDVRVEFETWPSVRDTIINSRDFESLIMGYRWGVDPDQHAMWSSDSILDAFNIFSYVNRDVDALLDKALVESDRQKRSELYAEVQDRVMDDLPMLPLLFPNQTIIVGPRLQDADLPAILMRNRVTITDWVPGKPDAEVESDN